MKGRLLAGAAAWCAWAVAAGAAEFTGPGVWSTVNTNGVKAWNAAWEEWATVKVWPGVVADVQKREVRLLAEAVGHRAGVTTEFLLAGPLSDRAYEAFAMTVAMPGDIVRAVESLGVPRGACAGSRPFRFWPYGERVAATVRLLDGPDAPERPLSALVADEDTEAPLLGAGGLVFTGGEWADGGCLADTNMPSSVVSLYNAGGTIFDVPFQVGQSEVYGRLSVAEALPAGALLEVVLRPSLPPDGKPRVLPLALTAAAGADGKVTVAGVGAERLALEEALAVLRKQAEAGREQYVTLGFDEAMTLGRAADVARVFDMLDGKGIKLDGKPAGGVYPRAFLPREKWRDREDRVPQPFEVHVARGEGGALKKKLVFIEEDWTVEGLDPKLTPREYPFERWEELPGLVEKTGGAESKVRLLFVFAPKEMPLGGVMPAVRVLEERLPLVYVFGD